MRDDANCTPGVRRAVIHRGARFDYVQAAFAGTDGREVVREYIRHPGAVVVVPVLESPGEPDRIVLIRNYRVSLDAPIWELPAGTLGDGEDPAACAARELLEETGYRAGRIDTIGGFYTSPGLSDELMRVFVARTLRFEGRRPEPDERMTVHPTPAAEAVRMVQRGELMDGKSLAALYLAERAGGWTP